MSTSAAEIMAKHEAGARALAKALNQVTVTTQQLARAMRLALVPVGFYVRAETATTFYGRFWRQAHPGRRLPGSMRNRRLAKKRAQYLERWAREEWLA